MSLILGLETSCDETAAAVVADGRSILSNVVASQIELHRRYGGVFPEVASRQHVLDITPVIEEALAQAGTSWAGLEAIAVTFGPGLVGSLLVGVNVAKAIAWAKGLPLIGVNHLEAHLYANWLYTSRKGINAESPPAPRFPLLCLIVSGGHSDLVWMTAHGQYRVLGRTVDDAAGEAFDKVARLLGLGYPGGPAIQKAAEGGNPTRFDFPRAMLKEGYDFSFSGVKTAVLRMVQRYEGSGKKPSKERSRQLPRAPSVQRRLPVADLAASFQAAVVDVLVQKTCRAAEEFQVEEVLLAGGVASNALLRGQMVTRLKVPVRYPPPILCTDNAAMVASAGYFKHMAGEQAGWDLDVQPGMSLHCEV
jgi:N6-L-threonylcarbamoyladenine synthase